MTTKFGLASMVVGALLAGCGGSDTMDMGAADMAQVALYKLQSGTYAVKTATGLVDGCMAFDAANPFSDLTTLTLTLTNDGNGNISLGDQTGTPPQASNGSSCPGSPANAACASAPNAMAFNNNVGTLVRDNNVDDGAGCTFHRHVENLVQISADNTFGAAYTRTDTMHAGCTVITTDCTTSWNWTLAKQ